VGAFCLRTADDTVAALLRETQAQLRTTEARLQDQGNTEKSPTTHSNEAQNSRIAVPSRLSDVTMHEIRTHLGYNKSKWSALRACVRDCLRAARLNWNADWRSQSTTKRGYAYNAIEADFPELRRFEGQWAVNRIAKDVWDNRKTYINCINNPSTYIGRRAAQRQGGGRSAQHSSSPTRAPLPRPSGAAPESPQPSGSALESPNRSPTPGPSRPHRRLVRINSSSDSGDDLLNFSDNQNPDGKDEEDEDGQDGKGKKRAKSSGGSSPKRHKR